MMDKDKTALITEIERFSTHDGPGIRTVVFLKGCPLRCAWCHNPECISFESETMRYPDKCIGCGKCDEGCYSGAITRCGRRMSVKEVMREILADRDYYQDSGGVTISGGEPLAHREFTLALIEECKRERLHVGIETSLYRFDREILEKTDLIMTDMKIFEDHLHKSWVGIGNEEIKSNLIEADGLGKPIIVRTPVITGVNDTKENIIDTVAFLKGLKNLVGYELLPYHPLGVSKAMALGVPQREFGIPTSEKMEELQKYVDISR